MLAASMQGQLAEGADRGGRHAGRQREPPALASFENSNLMRAVEKQKGVHAAGMGS